MIEKGRSRESRIFQNMLSNEQKEKIEMFYEECLTREYKEWKEESEVQTYIEEQDCYLSDVMREYSGWNYKHINNALRGTWNYEENGHEEQKERYLAVGHEMSEQIEEHGISLGNRKVFRGVNLSYFKNYGITSMEELSFLKGQLLIDSGFVSTSCLEKQCFFQKDNELGIDYNIEIEYLVPEEFRDGMLLGANAYNQEQWEYVINIYHPAKVIDATTDGKTAKIQAIWIPKKVYEEDYCYRGQTR